MPASTRRSSRATSTSKFTKTRNSIKPIRARRSTVSSLVSKDNTPILESTPPPTSSNRLKRIYISESDDDVQIVEQPITKHRRIIESDEENIEKPESSNDSLTTSKSKRQKEKIGSVQRRVSDRQKIRKIEAEKSDMKRLVCEKNNQATKVEVKGQNKCVLSASRERKLPEDEVKAEFGVVLLRPQTKDGSVKRIQFHQKMLQRMQECSGRIKNRVKHLQLTYKTHRNQEGIALNKVAALYNGIYKSENSTKGDLELRHAVGFFKEGQFFMLPIKETYEMTKEIKRPAELDIVEQNRSEDSGLSAIAAPVLNPIRVRFARSETEWQRKRREQSFQYRQMLYDQDEWVESTVQKEDARTVYKESIKKAKELEPAPMKQTIKLASL